MNHAMHHLDPQTKLLVDSGLERLQAEAFGPSGFAAGYEQVVHVLVNRNLNTYGHGYMLLGDRRVERGAAHRFSREGLNGWLRELKTMTYVPGCGTWITAEVHVFADGPGRLDLLDEERLQPDESGSYPPGGRPAGTKTWLAELASFPRTPDKIPQWMWDKFDAEAVMPPTYNPDSRTVDWKNERRPVTDLGTDFTIDPEIIDQSMELRFFTKISNKLFGS